MFLVGADEGLVEQVAEQVVSGHLEVNLVGLGEVCLFPLGHGTEASHEAVLVPDAGLVLLGEGEEGLAGDVAVRVLHVALFLDFAEHVVVRLEDDGRVRVHLLDAGDKLVVVVLELLVVESLYVGVVDADGENHEVGLVEGEFFFEQRADFFEVVVDLGAVDADVRVADAGVVGFGDDAGEREARTCVLLDGVGDNFGFCDAMFVGGVRFVEFAFGVVGRWALGLHVGALDDSVRGGVFGLFAGETGRIENVAFALEHGIEGGGSAGERNVVRNLGLHSGILVQPLLERFCGILGGIGLGAFDGILYKRIGDELGDLGLLERVEPAELDADGVDGARAYEHEALACRVGLAVDVGRIDAQHGNDVAVVAVAEQAELGFAPHGFGVEPVEHQRDFGARVAGAHGNTEQSERLGDFLAHVLAHVPDSLVVAGVARGSVGTCGGVGEYESAPCGGARVFLNQVLADAARYDVGLQVRTAYVQYADLALVLEYERVHLVEERLEFGRTLGELDGVERRVDERVLGEVDGVGAWSGRDVLGEKACGGDCGAEEQGLFHYFFTPFPEFASLAAFSDFLALSAFGFSLDSSRHSWMSFSFSSLMWWRSRNLK